MMKKHEKCDFFTLDFDNETEVTLFWYYHQDRKKLMHFDVLIIKFGQKMAEIWPFMCQNRLVAKTNFLHFCPIPSCNTSKNIYLTSAFRIWPWIWPWPSNDLGITKNVFFENCILTPERCNLEMSNLECQNLKIKKIHSIIRF